MLHIVLPPWLQFHPDPMGPASYCARRRPTRRPGGGSAEARPILGGGPRSLMVAPRSASGRCPISCRVDTGAAASEVPGIAKTPGRPNADRVRQGRVPLPVAPLMTPLSAGDRWSGHLHAAAPLVRWPAAHWRPVTRSAVASWTRSTNGQLTVNLFTRLHLTGTPPGFGNATAGINGQFEPRPAPSPTSPSTRSRSRRRRPASPRATSTSRSTTASGLAVALVQWCHQLAPRRRHRRLRRRQGVLTPPWTHTPQILAHRRDGRGFGIFIAGATFAVREQRRRGVCRTCSPETG